MTMRIAVLLSGRAPILRRWPIVFPLVASPTPKLVSFSAIAKALQESIAPYPRTGTRVIPSKGLEREAYDRLVVAALRVAKVDLICLAGYMRLLSPFFVAAFPRRILNIHPSLLPSFPGLESQSRPGPRGKIRRLHRSFCRRKSRRCPIVMQAVVPSKTATPKTLQRPHSERKSTVSIPRR